jgi:hypothetical protein
MQALIERIQNEAVHIGDRDPGQNRPAPGRDPRILKRAWPKTVEDRFVVGDLSPGKHRRHLGAVSRYASSGR